MEETHFVLTEPQETTLQEALKSTDLNSVIDAFYEEFSTHPSTESFFAGANIDDLKARQTQHWINLLNPATRSQAFQHSEHIGAIHEKLGVLPDIYLPGYRLLFETFLNKSLDTLSGYNLKTKRHHLIAAISKVLMADITASLVAYIKKNQQSLTSTSQGQVANSVIDGAVDASMAINQLFVDSLKASQIAKDVDGRINSISAAIEEMSATVGTITENTQQALEHTSKTSQSAIEGRAVSQEAQNNMNTIHEAVANTEKKAQDLSESSEQIKGIMTRIQQIAGQTNLLALNATIEAARAGEAGRGFAVVANEVKSLANQTSQSTQEISDIVGNFVDSIQEIVTAMKQVSESVATGQAVTEDVKHRMDDIEQSAQVVSDRMNDISNALGEQSLASNEISQASVKILENSGQNKEVSERNTSLSCSSSEKVTDLITNMASLTESSSQIVIKLAKSDHIVWKRKLADMLVGSAKLDEAELKDHTQCRLGKWYLSLGKEEFATVEAYQKLAEPHARIHRLGREAFELYQNENFDEAFDRLEQMEACSQEVIGLLNELDKIASA